jgi:hypothetical protein
MIRGCRRQKQFPDQGSIALGPVRKLMKRSWVLTFVISALSLFLGLAQGSPLYAQNQSRPQTPTCPLEGPSIADTLSYINGALAASPTPGLDQAMLVQQGDSLAYNKHFSMRGRGWNSSYAPIYSLNCDFGDTGATGSQFNTLNVRCISANCVTVLYKAEGDESWTGTGINLNQLIVNINIDDEHRTRLVRAFSHLIALLQQQYKQSHSDPNDPFAKP